jgi:Fe-S-cluster containining protein
LPLEAALILHYLDKEMIGPKVASSPEECRFLVNHLCTVYPIRPIICRTQGLALGYVDELSGAIDVSACPLNFSEEHEFSFDELIIMDEFNSRLALLNYQYCQKAGLESGERIELGRLL